MHEFMNTVKSLNPIQEGLWKHSIQGVFAKSNFWTADDKELKFYMAIEIHKLCSEIRNKIG